MLTLQHGEDLVTNTLTIQTVITIVQQAGFSHQYIICIIDIYVYLYHISIVRYVYILETRSTHSEHSTHSSMCAMKHS